jgi:general secretion pathway protein G
MRRHFHGRLSSARGDGGYTLTEMLVVIAIICLIAAAITPGIIFQLNRARVKTGQLQVQTVAAAVESFHSDVGRFPTQEEGLSALLEAPSAGTDGWIGPYVRDKTALLDPWGRPLVYTYDDDSKTFTIKSLGPDGKSGGAKQGLLAKGGP